MAGVHKVFIMTPQVHARKLFLEPYQHTWIPHFLLWSLGPGDAFRGVDRRLAAGRSLSSPYVAISLGFLLLTVTYGDALLELLCNVSSHILPRLILLLPTLALRPKADPWSLDAVLSRWRASKIS